MASKSIAVDRFMAELVHPLKSEIEQIRAIILGADDQITEQTKWNAPSFCYQGEDRVTLKLYPPDRIQLVFHRGAKVKESSKFSYADSTGLLQWVSADRAISTFRSMMEIQDSAAALAEAVTGWMKATTAGPAESGN